MKKGFLLPLAFILAASAPAISQSVSPEQMKTVLIDERKLEIDLQLSSFHQNLEEDIWYSYWQQLIAGVPIHNAVSTAVFDNNLRLRHFANRFIEVPKGLNHPKAKSPEQVLEAAMESVSWGENSMRMTSSSRRGDTLVIGMTGAYELDFQVEIFPVFVWDESQLIPAWNVSLPPSSTADWWQVRLKDSDLSFIEKNNWTVTCNHNHHGHTEPHYNWEHWLEQAQDIESADENGAENTTGYYVFRFPVESPNHGTQSWAVEPWDSLASPLGWHSLNPSIPVQFTFTRGNNVYAYEDRNASNTPGYSPDGGGNLLFDHTFDRTKSIVPNQDINITQLFYANNKAHDLFYQFGFTEAAGNFQQNNLNRGGSPNDAVIAEAMDGGGQNNANFLTPPDGTRGRMQMYPWSQSVNTEFLHIRYPSSAAGSYNAVEAAFGPRAEDSIVQGHFILLNDSSANPTQGCVPITQDLSGKIVLIDRGGCPFVEKVLNAQNAGASGVVVANNQAGNAFAMGGTPTSPITIPSVMITQGLGTSIRNTIQNDSVVGEISDTLGSLFFDSSLDNGVVLHEYGHGVSIRLTGGRFISNCLSNQEQAGEGWSDFFGLAFLTDPSLHQAGTRRGIGTFLIDQPVTGTGIRVQPYSNSLAQNSLTYNNIRTLSIPHGVGTVWAAMIWDMYWALVDKHGFNTNMYELTGGNNIAMKLVIEGLKLQPCSPGFVDSRDAILAADSILYNGENQCLIWEVFARRGLGFSADQGSPASRADGTQAFDTPEYCEPGFNVHRFDEDGVLPKVFPNPNNGVFSVDFALWEGSMDMYLSTLDGRKVKSWDFNLLPNSIVDVDARDLPAGMYILHINGANGKHVQEKLIIR
jgi:extracellular elastinolytic metalloproteinase